MEPPTSVIPCVLAHVAMASTDSPPAIGSAAAWRTAASPIAFHFSGRTTRSAPFGSERSPVQIWAPRLLAGELGSPAVLSVDRSTRSRHGSIVVLRLRFRYGQRRQCSVNVVTLLLPSGGRARRAGRRSRLHPD